MPTIKDVAKLAGVSHGTVSNIMNGVKGVSLDKVKKVEDAIKALGYQPDAAARSLKTNKTMNVGVVLPNITDPCFSQLFTGIERVLSDKLYSTSLYMTSEIAAKEKKILLQIQRQRIDGIIIATCQPDNSELFNNLTASGIKVVFVEREVLNDDFNFVGFNNSNIIHDAVSKLIDTGYKTIAVVTGPDGYYSEKQCIDGYKDALIRHGIPVNNRLIEIADLNKESAFKAAFRLLQLGEVPDAIITSSTQIAEGVLKAISICDVNLDKKPRIISLNGDSWTENSYDEIVRLPRQFMLMGETAAEILLDNIERPAFYDSKNVILNNSDILIKEPLERKAAERIIHNNKHSLKVLMLESSSSYATFSLLADFRKKEGINVEIDTLSYNELYETILEESLSSKYDVFSVDIPWLPELAEKGILSDLSGCIEDNPQSIEDLIPGILEEYAKYNEKFYVLPHIYGTQLLFYRKDLFENNKLQRLFYDEYRTELKPPKTWAEFNAIAKFFTKEYNPESPTIYGTTLGGKCSSGAVCEFLPRKWSFGGRSFDEKGNIVLYSKETIKALKNYCESYKYASPTSPDHWWYEQVEEFCSGKAAMMVLFMSHTTDITDRYKSKVVGKIGYDVVPGGTPLLGGWSLGINSNSKKKEQAFKFISWACCKDMAIPYTILGGSTPCVNLYKSSELVSIYPWLPKALESFNLSRKRSIPKSSSGLVISERCYEEIIGEAVYKSINNHMLPEDAISFAVSKLQALINDTQNKK
ncbi:MAG: extracellular solute-binding protein [Desulfitobacterium hafniense]|nr:extracellular solute-binding protein [Desulfitobacterium hafniense]